MLTPSSPALHREGRNKFSPWGLGTSDQWPGLSHPVHRAGSWIVTIAAITTPIRSRMCAGREADAAGATR